VTVPLFVQVTFVSVFTVRVAGLKAKFTIVILFPVLVGVLVDSVVGVLVGAVVGVLVGTVVGVLVGAVVVVPPQAARSTRRPAASRHSQTFVVINVWVLCISLPLLQYYWISTGEKFLSPSGRTLPGYIVNCRVPVALSICRHAIAIHQAPGPL
jgi:hypothetical protein